MPSALVIGASRGIGRQIAITLARNGYQVGVAAKTTQDSRKLPGTIHSVSDEIQQNGGQAMPICCNVRREDDIKEAIQTCISNFKKLDLVVYNAGSIKWDKVINTPLKRFDLMNEVNVRGAYCMVQEILPKFIEQKSGKILLVSPPIYSRFFKGKTPYSVGKVGMTVLVHGLANELQDTGVSITALWPATGIKSHVTKVMGVGDGLLREATIFADACLEIAKEPTDRLNGLALIDEDYLRSIGVTEFTKYRCDPDVEPPRMMPRDFPSLRVAEEDEVTIPKPKL
ncbi:hydroxysteroid dehydrogenase-like protein 2 [Ptychodera flava]|uniref:hydroxysteroid dehydrogenase-like protein 2 n=1 Tax=Ptychodera flava TaxID=63121 RepID=UPI00396AA6C8